MSRGFAHGNNDNAAHGFERPVVEMQQVTVANAIQFKKLAMQHCSGMIAQINKAETCVPGITGDALNQAKAVLASLQGMLVRKPAVQWPPVMPKDEEE